MRTATLIGLLAALATAGFEEGRKAHDAGDFARAITELEAAGDDPRAWLLLGNMYFRAEGVERDRDRATKYFERAAQAGLPEAQFRYGQTLPAGRERTQFRWMLRAAEQRHARAECVVGWMLAHGTGIEREPAAAREWYERSFRHGFARGGYELFRLGGDDSRRWLERSAEAGYPRAQRELGRLVGAEGNRKRAFGWFQKAAVAGDSVAMREVGSALEAGRGTAQDPKAAAEWYRMAAEKGNAWAADSLGLLLRDGRGVARDEKAAVDWFRKASQLGFRWGQLHLAEMFRAGRGVERDLVEAYFHATSAARRGDRNAQRLADSIRVELTPEQAAAADRRLGEK